MKPTARTYKQAEAHSIALMRLMEQIGAESYKVTRESNGTEYKLKLTAYPVKEEQPEED